MIKKILLALCFCLNISLAHSANDMQTININVFDDIFVGKINKKFKYDSIFKEDSIFRLDYIQGDKLDKAKILSIHSYLMDESNREQNIELYQSSLDGLKDYCNNGNHKMVDFNKESNDKNIEDYKYFSCSEFQTFTKVNKKYSIWVKSFETNGKLYVVTVSRIGEEVDNEPTDIKSFNDEIMSSLFKINICKNENKNSNKSCLKLMEKDK